MKKIIIPALILGVASVASFSAFANTGGIPMSGRALPKAEIIKALETNNYASLPDAIKAKITETQFQIAQEKYLEKVEKKTAQQGKKEQKFEKKHDKRDSEDNEAVKAAIEAGDYAAFREAKIAQIPTEAEFQKRVDAHKAHMVAITAIQTAIKNNDFTAFQKAVAEMRATMSELHDEDDVLKTPDVTQMKKHFEEMVAQYKADGTLPQDFGKGAMKKGEGMRE